MTSCDSFCKASVYRSKLTKGQRSRATTTVGKTSRIPQAMSLTHIAAIPAPALISPRQAFKGLLPPIAYTRMRAL